MKLFATICAVASLMTAAVNFGILRKFGAMYAGAETELPTVTRIVVWSGGALPTGLLVASALAVFAGLARQDKRLMVTGGIAGILMMLAAATVVPAALLIPMGKWLTEGHPPALPAAPSAPAPSPAPAAP
jgi:hypothetical protein